MMRYLYAFLTAAGLTFTLVSPHAFAQAAPTQPPDTPAFSSIPELEDGFHDLYVQKFPEAREIFEKWANAHPDEPFGQVAIAASHLFEEFYLQHVLTSDYFLNDKRFLGGITGTPDPGRIQGFQSAVAKARALAFQRLKKNSRDPEGLYTLTLAAGMESDAYSMLLKKHYDALKHLKEANVNAELLLKQRPDAYDAYVALGCANYIIGSLPGSARFMLWFGGIHGDKRLGMEQVQKTVDGGRYLKPFAQILLALSARREKQEALAQKLLKDLTEEFPGNPVYIAEYEKALGRPIPASIGPAQ
jgi:tetratricopeptide (TPR) repeat protein